ncbi:MAG TPA: response regulator transcription factor [Anaerolineales bacterium]|jgi:Response regulator containing a CheY-like receiver domain and an HTH DNA-binding domain
MKNKTRVTIMDDHQSIVDGYLYRLSQVPEIEVVTTLSYGDELEPALKKQPVDVLILDVHVPVSPNNPNPYPILYTIPHLLELYPELEILVISMFGDRSLIRAVVEAGASGYVLKNDSRVIQELGKTILSVAKGDVCFSEKAWKTFLGKRDEPFTSRQLEALSLCAAYPNSKTAELAGKMKIANSTLRNLLSTVYLKLGVQTRAAAIAKGREMGIITPDSTVPQL